MTKSADKHLKTTGRSYLKWNLILAGLTALVMIVVVLGFVGFEALLRPVATPPIIGEIEFQSEVRDTGRESEESGSATRLVMAPTPVAREPLIPEDFGIADLDVATREELNAAFDRLLDQFEVYEREKHTLDPKGTYDRLIALNDSRKEITARLGQPKIRRGRSPDGTDLGLYLDDSGREQWEQLDSAMRKRLEELTRRLMDEFVELCARHDWWNLAAQIAEYELKDWNQAVYYWRRHGDWDGYVRITQGTLVRRADAFRQSVPILEERLPSFLGSLGEFGDRVHY